MKQHIRLKILALALMVCACLFSGCREELPENTAATPGPSAATAETVQTATEPEGMVHYADGTRSWDYVPQSTAEDTVADGISRRGVQGHGDSDFHYVIMEMGCDGEEALERFYTLPESHWRGLFPQADLPLTENFIRENYKIVYTIFQAKYNWGFAYDRILAGFEMVRSEADGLWRIHKILRHENNRKPVEPDTNWEEKWKEDFPYDNADTPEETLENYLASWNGHRGVASCKLTTAQENEKLTKANIRVLLEEPEEGQVHFTREYLEENFKVMDCTYTVRYNSVVPTLFGGENNPARYAMLRDPETGLWEIYRFMVTWLLNSEDKSVYPAVERTVSIGEAESTFTLQPVAERTTMELMEKLREDPNVERCILQGNQVFEELTRQFIADNYQSGGREIFGREVPATMEYWQENFKIVYSKCGILYRSEASGENRMQYYRIRFHMVRDEETELWDVQSYTQSVGVKKNDPVIPQSMMNALLGVEDYCVEQADWIYAPAATPEDTVSYILLGENQVQGILACWELSVREDETATQEESLALAASAQGKLSGYTVAFLKEHFRVMEATYKVFYDPDENHISADGIYRISFSMMQDPATGLWSLYGSSQPELLEELEGVPIMVNHGFQPMDPSQAEYTPEKGYPVYAVADTPEGTVRNFLEGYSTVHGITASEVLGIEEDADATWRNTVNLASSERGEKLNYTREYLEENFAVLWAEYKLTYDASLPHEGSSNATGTRFSLVREEDTGLWYILDAWTPYTGYGQGE